MTWTFFTREGALLLTFTLAACIPARGSMPTQTWDPDDDGACTRQARDQRLDTSRWPQAEHDALLAQLSHDRPAVVSAIGCTVDVLPQCRVEGRYRGSLVDSEVHRLDLDRSPVHAAELEGGCEGATHVVTAAAIEGDAVTVVELGRLSLEGVDLTGTWRGVMRQPGGPYEVYDMRVDLEQQGDRVVGTSSLKTTDGAYYGDFRFEGRLEGNTLFFADSELLDDNLGLLLGWCMKGGFLLVDPKRDRLQGPWAAGWCIPGNLSLDRRAGKPARLAKGGGR